jgi:hypothetical protein
MRIVAVAALIALGACRPGYPDFGTPETIASSRPSPEAVDCVAGALLEGWGGVAPIAAGGRTTFVKSMNDVTMLRVEVAPAPQGATIMIHSYGMTHVQLRRALDPCR